MAALQLFLQERATAGLVPWQIQAEAAAHFGLSLAAVEAAIFEADLLPARYQRNRQMISTAQQQRLFGSTVAVVGAGGLGGYILEQLARLGVGRIIAIDDDLFEENNLNRQLLSSPARLGQAKVKAAAERIAEINPAVTLQPEMARFERASGAALLRGATCVVDAVDNVGTRLDLEKVCEELGLPLVSGAIAGWYGQVGTVFPGERTLEKVYRHWRGGAGVEQQLGNPSFTPAVIASIEVAEVCKLLLETGRLLRNRLFNLNLLDMEADEIPL